MAGSLYVHNFKKRSFVALLLSFVVLFGLISSVIAKPAQAKTVRLALVSSLEGDVTVKKGGGSKIYDAYAKMSLNQGDTLYTGSASSVVLDVSNGDSEITIGADSEFNISDLAGGNAKKSKLKMWAGSMWVKVKSLAGSNDEFEVETPTAVMGVRGTQFFVGVNPNTGKTTMAVGAGKVAASIVTYNQDGSAQQDKETLILPTQQITLDSRDEVKDLSLKVEPIDIVSIVNASSNIIIEAIVKNKQSIDDENAQFIENEKKKLEQGQKDNNSIFSINNINDLNKIAMNLNNLVGNIVIAAIDNKVIDKDKIQKVIDEANNKITDPAKKLDLDKVVPLDKTAGIDPEKEKLKQQLLEQLQAGIKKSEEERKKQEEDLRKLLEAALKQAEEQAKKQAELNKKAAADALAKAEEVLKKTMTNAENEKFDKDKRSTTPSTGSEPSSDSSPSLSASVLINNNDSITYFPIVTLNLTTNFATQVSISATSNPSTDNYVPYSPTIKYKLPSVGVNNVFVKFKDAAGSILTKSDSINYVQPTVSISPSTVTLPPILVSASVTGAAQYKVYESGGAENAAWMNMPSSSDGIYNLPFNLSSGNGPKTIYAQFKNADNSLSTIASATVTLNASTVTPSPSNKPTKPNVMTVNNYSTTVTGTADVGAIVVVKKEDGTVIGSSDSITDPSGNFSVMIPKQNAGSTLIVIASKNGLESDPASLTVMALPKVTLSSSNSSVGNINVDINMNGFTGSNKFYAVEVHLLYERKVDTLSANSTDYIHYDYKHALTHDAAKSIFSYDSELKLTNSVEVAKEYSSSTQNELVYVITNYGSATPEVEASTVRNQLVSIPFIMNQSGTVTIKVGYIKIVHMDGTDTILIPNVDNTDIEPIHINVVPVIVPPLGL